MIISMWVRVNDNNIKSSILVMLLVIKISVTLKIQITVMCVIVAWYGKELA